MELLNKFDNIETLNTVLDLKLDMKIFYSFINRRVNDILIDGKAKETDVNVWSETIKSSLEDVEYNLNKIDEFKNELIKLQKVMEEDLYRLKNSTDKEIKRETFQEYEIYTFSTKWDKWKESEVNARLRLVTKERIIFESGNDAVNILSSKDLSIKSDVWSNRKEFNKKVKEWAREINAKIIKG